MRTHSLQPNFLNPAPAMGWGDQGDEYEVQPELPTYDQISEEDDHSGYESDNSSSSDSDSEPFNLYYDSDSETFNLNYENIEANDRQELSTSNNTEQVRRSTRKSKQTNFHWYKATVAKKGINHRANTIKIPITTLDNPTVRQALNSTPCESELWKKAIDEELSTLDAKGTWTPVRNRFFPKYALATHIVLKKGIKMETI